jgi:hypothetical protein
LTKSEVCCEAGPAPPLAGPLVGVPPFVEVAQSTDIDLVRVRARVRARVRVVRVRVRVRVS